MDFRKETRGLRNNNPGNIRHGNSWKGEIMGKDNAFETFEFVEWGIRAIYVTLNTYRTKYKCTTVEQIINRWAPPSENNTKNYVVGVLGYISQCSARAKKECEEDGAKLDVFAAALLDEMVAAIIFYESGFNPFNLEFIRSCKDL